MIKNYLQRCVVFLACFMLSLVSVNAQGLKKVYDEGLNQMVQIDEALKEACASGRFVVCQVGGNWCPWCLKFAAFVESDSTVNKVVNDNFVYIHVNYNPSQVASEELKASTAAMMERLGNPRRFGFPVFVVLDQEGRVIHTQDSGFLESGQGYDRDKVVRFFECWTPKAVGGTE